MGKNEHERKAQVYDDFVEYVILKVRDRDNPNVTVRDFSLMPRSGVTHMSLVLENVSRGTKSLFEKVEAFAPGTQLKAEENITDGSSVYTAHVPFTDKHSGKSSSKHHKHRHYDQPNPTYLVVYGFGFMLLLLIGVWKTEWSQWRYLLG